MKKIVIYDPAMCCSTGVCGASVDKELLRVATVIDTLKQKGAQITRFNLATEPNAYVENKTVSEYLKKFGPDILPITEVDGCVIKTKAHLTNEEFAEWAGVAAASAEAEENGCCCCKDGCC